MKSILVIGGGASGLMAAITAATTAHNAGVNVSVTVLEKSHRVGRSILTAGNGRCNFGNSNLKARSYYNASFVGSVFTSMFRAWASSFGVHSKVKFDLEEPLVAHLFANLGLCWRETEDGWCYPASEKATSVLNVLLETASMLPISIRCESAVTEIVTTGSRTWAVRLDSGEILHGDAVILACGGRELSEVVLPQAVSKLSQKPILGALKVQEAKKFRDLDGFRIKCKVSLARLRGEGASVRKQHQTARKDAKPLLKDYEVVAVEEGEVLFRKYGISGISIFNLSRFAQPGDTLLLDFCPNESAGGMEAFLNRRFKVLNASRGPVTFRSFLVGMVAEPLATHLLNLCGVHPDALMSKADVLKLMQPLKSFELTVVGVHDPSQCQVMRGGLAVAEWNSTTLQHASLPGLFAAGEALDVDGPCGGYNLSWAWLSGMVAGNAAALTVVDEDYRQAYDYADCGLAEHE